MADVWYGNTIKPMKVLLFSRYGYQGASSRLRSYQYLPFLKSNGVHVTAAPLFDDAYLTELYNGNRTVRRIISAYLKRSLGVARSHQFDLIWIEKELLPWIPAWFESYLCRQKIPIVVDYDDAIFHKYDGNRYAALRTILGRKIDHIMQKARLVIVGNDYLAQRAEKAGARWVEKIPTVIDLKRYSVSPVKSTSDFTVGWVGSPTTAGYLKRIEPALVAFCRNTNTRLVIVGAGKQALSAEIPVVSLPWSEDSEVASINTFDVGIMPLPTTAWARGKCGYKLIQYMGCGRPVIASAITADLDMVQHGENGFLADSQTQWVKCLETLYNDRTLGINMGKKGRRLVADHYALQVTAPRLKTMLLRAGRRRPIKATHVSFGNDRGRNR